MLMAMSRRWQRLGLCLLAAMVLGGLGVGVALAANVTGSHRSGVAAHSSSVADEGGGCVEPQFIKDELGTVGRPFLFSESVSCLPGGHEWSDPVIHWGDETISPGVITAVSLEDDEFGGMSVAGQHIYSRPGSFLIWVEVTDQIGQTYRGGWHTDAFISAPSPPPPVTPTPAQPGSPTPEQGSQNARASAHGRVFTALRGKSRRRVVAVVSTTLPAAQVRARISWGDGTVSEGIVSGSAPELRVSGRHRWRRSGRYVITVTVKGPSGKILARAAGRANVRAQ
jgi:hypothetical protein